MDQGRDLLQAGASRRRQTDAAPAHGVGKAQSGAVDNRGAAIGPHHQQAPLGRRPLQVYLILQWNVIAEQEHVHPLPQRLFRLGPRKPPRHGDNRQICAGIRGLGRGQGSGPPLRPLLPGGLPAADLGVKERNGRLGRLGALRPHGYHRVVDPEGLYIGPQQAGILQQLAVVLGAHHHGRAVHSLQLPHHAGGHHQGHRIEIEVLPHLILNDHAVISLSVSLSGTFQANCPEFFRNFAGYSDFLILEYHLHPLGSM